MSKAENIEENVMELDEQKKSVIRMNEDDILNALVMAGSFKTDEDETATIEVIRKGKVAFSFRIRPLGEDEYLKCRKENTTYKRNKSVGTRVAESVDTGRYRSQLIYMATVEAEREKLWDNRKAWDRFAVLNGIDLIEAVLRAGEKDQILDKLDEISGYSMTAAETAKN